jgi:hypothetical protein
LFLPCGSIELQEAIANGKTVPSSFKKEFL